MTAKKYYPTLMLLALCCAAAVIACTFIDWPLNRDVTTYATVAKELIEGKRLYVDVWDLKPPAIFVTYMLAQGLGVPLRLQALLMHLLPTLIVLVALVRAAPAAGFGTVAGFWAGLFWVALSGNTALQTEVPNTEVFINACCSLAFLQLLRLKPQSSRWALLAIGFLFALAFLYKTVAIAIAAAVAIAYLLAGNPAMMLAARLRQLLWISAAGAAALVATFTFFAVTGRREVFWEVILGAGVSYAGDMWENIIDGLTFYPVVGSHLPLNVTLAVAPWIAYAVLAAVDRGRRRCWILLGAYGLGSLIAAALPGSFYAHYYQLLLPPVCLSLGWLTTLVGALPSSVLRKSAIIAFVLAATGLLLHESRTYIADPEVLLFGTYQEQYIQTELLGRRLGASLTADEVFYQWGEESGLYWYSGKRPPAAVLTFYLFDGPQAERLSQQTLRSLQARPPNLIVAANSALEGSEGHPVFDWIRSNYQQVQPSIASERKFFTFFLPPAASAEFRQRILGTAK